ncbi:hypothetical protein QF001_000892 [Paraburkholderia youngii]
MKPFILFCSASLIILVTAWTVGELSGLTQWLMQH